MSTDTAKSGKNKSRRAKNPLKQSDRTEFQYKNQKKDSSILYKTTRLPIDRLLQLSIYSEIRLPDSTSRKPYQTRLNPIHPDQPEREEMNLLKHVERTWNKPCQVNHNRLTHPKPRWISPGSDRKARTGPNIAQPAAQRPPKPRRHKPGGKPNANKSNHL